MTPTCCRSWTATGRTRDRDAHAGRETGAHVDARHRPEIGSGEDEVQGSFRRPDRGPLRPGGDRRRCPRPHPDRRQPEMVRPKLLLHQRVLLRRRAVRGHAHQPQGFRDRQDLQHAPERPERGRRPLLHRGHLLRPGEAQLGPGADLQPHRPGHDAEVPSGKNNRPPVAGGLLHPEPGQRRGPPAGGGREGGDSEGEDVIGSVIAKLNPILDETRQTVADIRTDIAETVNTGSTAAGGPWAPW